SMHFSINHSGLPDIDPAKHRLVIHGMVRQPLVFTVESLLRYPMESRMAFVECSGNSAPMFSNQPVQATAQALHGLVSCSEWTGVRLSTLLDEAGFDPKAKWVIAEGGDALALHRSVPMKKALDDAMIGPGYSGRSGMAYSGSGGISRVMVSADGGKTWAQAALQEPVHSKAFARFRAPWRWNGSPAVLQSRAWDEAGNAQPTRAEFVA